MTPKQRDVVFLRWSGEIRREARDFASLDHMSSRLMSDPDVRDDDELQSMLRAVIQQKRDDVDQALRFDATHAATAPAPTTSTARAHVSHVTAPKPQPPAVSLAHVWEMFNVMARSVCDALERRNESEVQAALKSLRTFQERNPSVIPSSALDEYSARLVQLRAHLQGLENQIGPLTQRAVAASKSGNEQELARATMRLQAIHAAHPTLLGEAGLEEIRRTILVGAQERRDYQSVTRKLIDRQRAIIGEIKVLAAAVHRFHEVACTVPEATDQYRLAEAAYLATVRSVSTYDSEWITGVILELADLLAEWSVPPLGAENQIERFLDSISRGLKNIRAEIRRIDEMPEGEFPEGEVATGGGDDDSAR